MADAPDQLRLLAVRRLSCGEMCRTSLVRAWRLGAPSPPGSHVGLVRRAQRSRRRKIVTQIIPASGFYRAEEYHQRYLEKHGRGSCAATIR